MLRKQFLLLKKPYSIVVKYEKGETNCLEFSLYNAIIYSSIN